MKDAVNKKMEDFYKKFCIENSSRFRKENKNTLTLEKIAYYAATLSYKPSVQHAICFGEKKREKKLARAEGEKIISSFLLKCFEEAPVLTDQISGCWNQLHTLYREKYEIEQYSYGNAQKWVNMSIKYFIIILSQNSLEYKKLMKIPVFPVDGIMIKKIKKQIKNGEFKIDTKIPEPWSKCDDKDAFINFIKAVDSQKKQESLFEYELISWDPK